MLRRHAPDVVSLVFGTLFAGAAAIWLLSAADVIDYEDAWIAGPVILIVAGVLGLVVALRPAGPASLPWQPPAPDQPAADPATENADGDADADADAKATEERRDE
jgi:hypothetical protein